MALTLVTTEKDLARLTQGGGRAVLGERYRAVRGDARVRRRRRGLRKFVSERLFKAREKKFGRTRRIG